MIRIEHLCVRLPGFSLAYLMRSATELIGKAGLTTRMNGRCATIAIGWKSFTGS